MILVVGSTGKLGMEVCWLLRTRNLPVRAMVRNTSDPEKLERLRAMGVSLMKGDLRDRNTLPHALNGITTVIATVSSIPFSYLPGENDIQKVDEEGMINLIDESEKNGVNHFIYVSFSKNIDLEFPLSNTKRRVENHLQQREMQYTILRPSYFMDAWLSPSVGFDAFNGNVNLYGTGTNPVAYIAIHDVARFAVECVSNPPASNATIELGGPQNLSQIDAVRIFEEVLNRKIEIHEIPETNLQAQFEKASDNMQKSFTGLMLCLAKGDYVDMKDILIRFPIQLASVEDFAKKQAENQLKLA